MGRECDLNTSNITVKSRSEVTPQMESLLKYHFESHCKGKFDPAEGVAPAYVKEMLTQYQYIVIITSKNHMGTRSKAVEKLCGFLFLKKKGKHAYIDIVCSSDKTGWRLLDFTENWVRENWKTDVVYLNALGAVKCMYAFRGYREVSPSQGCKMTATSQPAGSESKGFRMSKCVQNGKNMSTKKLLPRGCNAKQNRQLYKEYM